MAYRKILVPVFGIPTDRLSLSSAFGIAKQFGSHVEALFVRPDPLRTAPYGGIETGIGGVAVQYAIESAIKAADAAQQTATDLFNEAAKAGGVTVSEAPGTSETITTFLKVTQGDPAEDIERESRLSDLVVFATERRGRGDGLVREGFEAVLLSGSRPVLFTPHAPLATLGQTIGIAFDGSAAAAHAVTLALPFLTRAKAVHAFEAAPGASKSTALQDLKAYLALRGVAVTASPVEASHASVGETLTQAATGKGCDLLVLGGYGHSRLREFVLGGVTRHMLGSGVPFVVLMAH